MGWYKGSLIGQKKKGKVMMIMIIMKKECTKEVMPNSIACHLLTNSSQTLSSNPPVPGQLAIASIVQYGAMWHRTSLWPVWVCCPGCDRTAYLLVKCRYIVTWIISKKKRRLTRNKNLELINRLVTPFQNNSTFIRCR